MSNALADPGHRRPGERLGLPATGRGSLASWRSRIAAILLDWAVCMGLSVLLFGTEVVQGEGWEKFMPLTLFFVESAVLSALTGGSLGQLVCRIGIIRLDGHQLGFLRAVPRAAMVCLALPALVVDGDRRGLNDLLLGTVVVNRR
ncbi:RDD family protein [Desertihabitans brevis]|uniref:RDD family protein n=1 Tax=Desertihabitans brevis TaxID=2268447 RepID=A0A367YUG9_9ACTN|nr:RDD family protein [Desertihabitans brevis]RCK69504.1 RDD family protein [Desertihabitans brevis]